MDKLQGGAGSQQAAMGQTMCPICSTHLSYPLGSQCILCPVCKNSLSPPQTGAQPQQQQIQLQPQNMIGQSPQARCVGCGSLLAYPPNAVYIQCPSCFQTMATQPNSNALYASQQPLQGKASKKRKDPQAPKAVTNAYMIFCKSRRNELKAAHPELAFGKIGARLGEIWRNMTQEEKKPYEDRAAADRDRYRNEMLTYQAGKMMALDPELKKLKTDGGEDDSHHDEHGHTDEHDEDKPIETKTETHLDDKANEWQQTEHLLNESTEQQH